MKTKHITFISLNYYPEDTAIGLYSSQWVEFLEHKGFEVNVITAFPYYPQWKIKEDYQDKPRFFQESKENVKIYRYKQYVPKSPTFLKRILHLIDFTIGSFFNLYKIKKTDLVISVVPFTSSVFLGYIQKRRFKAPLWTHVQDFEFDAALQTGVSKKTNLLFSLLFKLERWLFSKADIASTISHSMIAKLKEKTPSETYFLPNWIDEKQINPNGAKQHPYLQSNKLKILYSGNIGDKQDWNAFLQLCEDINPQTTEIILVGAGAKKEWLLEKVAAFDHVTYYPPVEYKDLSDLLCSADVHILFQKTDVVDTVMPSKVLGMMASAKPSIIIGNELSEVKKIFDTSEGGLYYNQYSESIVKDLEQLIEAPEKAQKMGENARKFVVNNFSKDSILENMLQRINNL